MKKVFTYSVLQYKHSLALGEAINVGVLFAFPENEKLEFVYGSATRLRAIYPNFDSSLFLNLLKNLEGRLKSRSSDLFYREGLRNGLTDFIHSEILREDATTLQFAPPVSIVDVYDSQGRTVKELSKILLPGILVNKSNTTKVNEDVIIKRFTNYIFDKRPDLDQKIERTPVIQVNDLPIKFDFAYQNGAYNYIKAISFDLHDRSKIEHKAFTQYGFLMALQDVAKDKGLKFNLIVAQPKDEELYVAYKNAVRLIESVDANKDIIPANRIDQFSDKIIKDLEDHYNLS